MFKYLLLLPIVFLTSACEAGSSNNGSDTNLTDAEIHQQSKYMRQAFKETPYAALVEVISVKTIDMPDDDPTDDYAEQKLVYQVNVIETFRGEKRSQLSYNMYIEKGDSVESSSEPFIITLCQSEDGFYWPGVGASFSADKRLIAIAKKQARELDNKQVSFAGCDE
ncbi:MAG: hypothetical protein P8179_20100 [Candidatus Thiodiazotropha sp.]